MLERDVITDPVPQNTSSPASGDAFEAALDSESAGIHTDAGPPGLNPIGVSGVNGILTAGSQLSDAFWYSSLEPLPIDIDFGSA